MSDQQTLSLQWPSSFESTPDAVVIWLHGLGADAADFPPAVPYLGLAETRNIQFIFPNAPVVPVTVNGGWEMRAWYDILLMEPNQRVIREEDLDASVRRIETLVVNAMNSGVAANRIFLVGFSQGGAVAYEAGLRISPNIGGVVAMSTYLARELHTVDVAASVQLPILVLHGDQDDVVTPFMCDNALKQLKGMGFSPEEYRYPMAHEVSVPSLKQLGLWLQDKL
jgi:phospholipase/carboxylesterase